MTMQKKKRLSISIMVFERKLPESTSVKMKVTLTKFQPFLVGYIFSTHAKIGNAAVALAVK